MGSLPAATGLILLYVLFSILQPTFGGLYNLGNMLTEGAGPIFIAMGLVFVLLLGEIDLSPVSLPACALRHGAAHGRLPRALAGLDRRGTGHRCGDRSAHRPAAGQGPHSVLRGHAGVLPGFPGCRPLHRENGKGQKGDITITAAWSTASTATRCRCGPVGCSA